MSTVISVEHLSKTYRLGMIGGGLLREDLSRWWAKMLRKPDPHLKIGEEHHARLIGQEFWALQDVNFEVKDGEILGIIGRNGAGKSTLLKILSRVTGPTSGCVKIKGRVASLLEVGTGFHPELTGRENIFLNGTILGMTKAEIRKKFDEIVAFSEIEEFIDTPVKRYSSGMYVRLAFAVAAHLEPEILIVDEVLAVGDAQFQKKCLGKMSDVSREGRTVLFVSHNMQALSALCSRAILLNQGKVDKDGSVDTAFTAYQALATNGALMKREQVWGEGDESAGNDYIRLHRLSVLPDTPDKEQVIGMATPICVEVEYRNLVPSNKVVINLAIYSMDGSEVLEDWTIEETNWGGRQFPRGCFRTTCRIPGNLLNAGTYRLRILFFEHDSTKHLFDLKEAAFFSVEDLDERPILWHGQFKGLVHPKLNWKTEFISPDVAIKDQNHPPVDSVRVDVPSLPTNSKT